MRAVANTNRDLDYLAHKPVKSKADSCKGLESIPEPLPKSSFFMVVNGRPGSGKTSFLYKLLAGKANKLYNRKFDVVHMWSPSMATMQFPLPRDRIHPDLDMKELQTILDTLPKGKHCLLIFDDMVANLRAGAKPFLKMILNRRHCAGPGGTLSCIVCTQKYNLVPLQLRNAVSCLVLFSMNKTESKIIWNEIAEHDLETWEAMTRKVFDAPYQFLFIRVDKPSGERYYKCFDRLEIPSHAE